jgi:TP901 family phage tail tape measure protein
MGLEAQEVAIRTRLVGGTQFMRDADGVANSIRGIGAAGAEANKASGVESFLSGTNKVLDVTGARLKKVGSHMKQFGMNAMTASIPLLYLGDVSVKASMSFQQSMSLLQRQANDSAKDVAYLTRHVQALPNALGKPTDLATGLYNIVSSGHHGADAMHALRAAAMGAKVGVDDLQNTTLALMGVMNSGLKDVKGKGYGNAMGILDAIVGQGMMHLPDLTTALHSEILPLSKDTGLGLKDIGSVMSAMTRQNIPADRFANLMKLTLTKLMSPNGAALKALTSIGLQQYSLADDMRKPHGLLRALEDLQSHLHRVGRDQRFSVLAAAFGQSRGISNIASILNQMPTIMRVLGVLDKKGNATSFGQHYGQYLATNPAKMAALQGEWQKFELVLGNNILPVLIPMLTKLTGVIKSLLNDFSHLPKGVQSTILELMGLGIAIGPVVWILGSLFSALGAVVGAVGFTVGLFGAGGAIAKVIPGLVGMFGGVAIEGGVMRAAFVGILPEIAAVTLAIGALVAFINTKTGHKVVNWIKHQGHEFGSYAIHGAAAVAGLLGVHGPQDRINVYDYLHGKTFGHLSSKQRSAMLDLLGQLSSGNHVKEFKGSFGDTNLGSRNGLPLSWYQSVLAGVQLPSWLHIPHLTDAHHRVMSDAVSNGELNLTVHNNIYMDGKLAARTVNRINRQTANRR